MDNPLCRAAGGADAAALSLTRLLDALALGTILVLAWRACSSGHRRRSSTRSARAPAPVHTWEGEGGRPLPAEHEASTANKAS